MNKKKKMKFKKIRVRKPVLIILFLVVSLSIFAFLQFTRMEGFDDSVVEFEKPLEPGSELTYYLDVTYDGVDREGIESSNETLSKIYSDYIYVEDKLPDGLTFKEFEVASFMTGAKPQGDIDKVCNGYVYDDSKDSTDPKNYKGLHYDEETRMVSFRIKNLQAGCHLTVGIVTVLPETVDDPTTTVVEKRRDFWNSATAWEGSQIVTSNLVHAWIESEEAKVSTVTYRFAKNPSDGTEVPSNAPIYHVQEYAEGTSVGVMPDPKIEGYIFKGWKIVEGLSAEIKNGSFIMPAQNVVIEGYFEKIPKNLVIYEIDGDIPNGYIVPEAKEYYRNATVTLDSMEKDTIVNGYKFLGWTTTDVEVDEDGYFVMPDKDVTIKGRFEVIKYTVEYKYQGSVPEGAVPPAAQEYPPGENVVLPNVSDVGNYEFLSWDKANGFEMPSENVIVYGEWKVKTGLFAPTITKEIMDKKEYYRIGDVVKYKITVTNTATYTIKNIQVKENHPNAKFVSDGTENYKIKSDHIAEIVTIPTGASATITAEYIVTESDKGTITNEVEIIGALAETSNFSLDTTKEYKDTAEFKVQSKLEICKNVDKISNNNLFQFTITGSNFKTNLNIEGNTCKSIYLVPGEYRVTENPNQEYRLDTVTGSITTNGGSVTIENNKEYSITFNNKLKNQGFFRTFGNVINEVRGTE